METFRSFITMAIQSAALMTVAYTTIFGFALGRRSWGLLGADLFLLLALLAIEWRLLGVAHRVLEIAESNETDAATHESGRLGEPLAASLLAEFPRNRPWWRRHVLILLLVAPALHVTAMTWLATSADWSLVGRS
jgi:hypothetical protein